MTDGMRQGRRRTPLTERRARMAKRLILPITLLAIVVALVSGCARSLPAPARAVESVLELRSKNSTDTAAYARYFKESSVATALAEDAAAAGGKSRIPEWETPKVEESTDTSASVLVEWKASKEFKGWPSSTTFVLAKSGDRWVIVDATAQSSETTKTP